MAAQFKSEVYRLENTFNPGKIYATVVFHVRCPVRGTPALTADIVPIDTALGELKTLTNEWCESNETKCPNYMVHIHICVHNTHAHMYTQCTRVHIRVRPWHSGNTQQR